MWIKNICLLCFLCKTNCTTVNCQEIWICNCNTDLMRVWANFAQMSDVSFCLLFSKNAHYIHFHINHQIKHFIVYMLFFKLRKYFFELYFLTFFTSDLVKSIIFPQYMYQIFFLKIMSAKTTLSLSYEFTCLSVRLSVGSSVCGAHWPPKAKSILI